MSIKNNKNRSLSALLILLIGLISGLQIRCTQTSEKPKEVNLAIWGNYISPEAQKKFTDATGITIKISNYSSNEELLAKVEAGASGYDVAVPSDYMVDILIKQQHLLPLDKSKIPNIAGYDPAMLRQPFDRDNTYSLPYAWTTAGIAVNRTLFKGKINSWKDFFEAPGLSGKISLLDDARETLAIALKIHGFSINTKNPEEIEKAKKFLIQHRSRIKQFSSDTIDPLVNKEVIAAHAYSPDALQAAERSKGDIEYILPEEGGTRAMDNLVILKKAKNVEAAHALINFILSKEVNVDFVLRIKAGPVLSATKNSLSDELKNNSSLFPTAAQMKKFEWIEDIGEHTKNYEDAWMELKAK